MRSVGACPTEEWKPAQLPADVGAHTRDTQPRVVPASTWDGTRCEPTVPRKEVIQPHLPVRLPCYDFTPITDPTLDACLPGGLAQRLQVLPTFVV
jgi:hypothetical protein